MKAKLKQILRFYFSADSLNKALDAIIENIALNSWKDGYDNAKYFTRINSVVEVKGELSDFWARLNGVMLTLTDRDLATLKGYARLRSGISRLDEDGKRELHRAVVKFSRKTAGLLNNSDRALKCISAYYALISPKIDN